MTDSPEIAVVFPPYRVRGTGPSGVRKACLRKQAWRARSAGTQGRLGGAEQAGVVVNGYRIMLTGVMLGETERRS